MTIFPGMFCVTEAEAAVNYSKPQVGWDRSDGAPFASWPAQARHPRRVPGMALILEVQVLCGPVGRNR